MKRPEPRLSIALDWNRRLMQQSPGASCHLCHVENPFVLVLNRNPTICYECRAVERGLSGTEMQDLGGRPSRLPQVPIGGNLHRVLTYLQLLWRRAGHRPSSTSATIFDVLVLVLLAPVWAQFESASRRQQ
jgi:hypothetical protein